MCAPRRRVDRRSEVAAADALDRRQRVGGDVLAAARAEMDALATQLGEEFPEERAAVDGVRGITVDPAANYILPVANADELKQFVFLLFGVVALIPAGLSGYFTERQGFLSPGALAFAVTALALLVIIGGEPWYAPQYAIPLLGMVIGKTLMLIALAGGPPGLVSILVSVAPVIQLPIIWLVTKERPAAGAWAGAALAGRFACRRRDRWLPCARG